MFEKEEIIEIAKSRLGHPIVQLELTDEICNNLFSDSVSTFEYYAILSKNYESNFLNNITKKEFFEIRYNWVLRYFTASLKESLGNTRGKFSGEINALGESIKLDYSHLIRESESEKIAIIKDIYPQYEYNLSPFVLLGVYVSIGHLSSEDISSMLLKIQKDFKSSLPDFIKLVIMPTKSETKTEVIYSNNSNKKIDFELFEILKDLDDQLEKYIKDEE